MKKVIRVSYTNNELYEIARKANEQAKKMNVNLSTDVFEKYCKLNFGVSFLYTIKKRFATKPGKKDGWGVVQKRLGVRPRTKFDRDLLFDKLYELYKDLGNKQPTQSEITKARISNTTITRYFGKLSNAMKEMYKVKGIKQEYILPPSVAGKKKIDRAGDSLMHLPLDLAESPVNEQGVVLLFGKIHFAIGFPSIIKVQQGFPDCKAYSTIGGVYHRANIEFKFKSNSYIQSTKTPEEWEEKVNYLVCWEHNSRTFNKKIKTVQVISLKRELMKKEVREMIFQYYSGKLQTSK